MLIKLTPNASRDTITGIVATAGDEMRLALKVRAVPEKGRANTALIAFVAKLLALPKSSLKITSGSTIG